ncbi:subunit 4 of actin-related protein 2/3 complex [Mitosporidium daphniae]|uniref:Subunit 4 of actin-related protein 2/3 complex n=1 Tax=Mitosporidium daphniae TaxID=1485682 RepID=A0A098VSL2_9MICR|nr:subunit 4 of actin-related protein 2/3 complex [Mitosporidium daphniae]KGG51972.1 subunit 4 of actin-related protein 2/3 complex [Mitosporidium daphniae]|eukprot:XP_013238408.1 subunit 4 of actin-related protein 2/3 complex [Mitosporidium daphniae]
MSSISSTNYLSQLRAALGHSLALRSFSSASVERHNKPEIEIPSSPFTILEPIKIYRSDSEYVLIERSINSARISFKLKQADEIERFLVLNFSRFLMHRAETLLVIRRVAVKGYDISFLVTNTHVEEMLRSKLVDFFCYFLESVDKEISAMKISVNSHARYAAEEFLKQWPYRAGNLVFYRMELRLAVFYHGLDWLPRFLPSSFPLET